MKRFALVMLLAIAVAGASAVWMAPPDGRALGVPSGMSMPVRGAIHVHTRRSDGAGTVDDVAAAAARAGLAFVILTDHGDATREADPPAYRHGVLCIDAVEISTDGGHVIALGAGRAPYPLGGEPRDVVEDIRRLGGMSIAAHPGSPKPELRWLEWTAPFDGLEWLNGDSEWRDEARAVLARALLTYPVRRTETLASLLDRPESVIARWDALTERRRVVAVAGADAHARLWTAEYGDGTGPVSLLHLPSYEQMFRTFSIAVTGVTLTGAPVVDAQAIVGAIRAGHLYSSIDALAAPAVLTFTAASAGTHAGIGDVVAPGQPVTLRVDANAPDGARIVLIEGGSPLASASGASLQQEVPGRPGVYRVEVHLAGAPGDPPVPWIVSNPIYVQPKDALQPPADPRGPPTEFFTLYDDGIARDAAVESSARAQGALDVAPTVGGTQLSLRYALGGTRSESPYVALVLPAGPALSGYDRLMFTARAAAPMRLSVQVRVPEGPSGERWHRSVYLDQTPREVVIPFDDMTPSGPTARRRPVLQTVRDLLFVVDTVNAAPGSSGQIWIDDVRYAR